ncbi:DNA repair and recombination helicase protein PIF1, putative [Trypanosoma brucei brucei TREU927]|uniref:ATP-dependent DNA helicase PIF7 n=1 Tax=Trypanosoma brucei brucei (strain 927/4 GUTat10.1) TaxID=185431 RepID=PIF7_TRYB2|nr:DNA repair and recombination helicase protein PIF1, putative [Trypanosoma brucei brucei TREU927]Q57YG0.1 RecName: Full=ATP-dependent DNA helicase PIF7; AltName: Full=DNA repair and recombination helicase PIF7; Flags: Precursor [Trypanosoma brucei brucei TREU927]AAX69358.1 DNA repair and recombination helicase protein PIF1, putative [Trypanosoma brucei]AAZ12841.1 DNA repair and recombination helicase protein PIF1, putative [Trypanosoma brucei brucei TREU927]
MWDGPLRSRQNLRTVAKLRSSGCPLTQSAIHPTTTSPSEGETASEILQGQASAGYIEEQQLPATSSQLEMSGDSNAASDNNVVIMTKRQRDDLSQASQAEVLSRLRTEDAQGPAENNGAQSDLALHSCDMEERVDSSKLNLNHVTVNKHSPPASKSAGISQQNDDGGCGASENVDNTTTAASKQRGKLLLDSSSSNCTPKQQAQQAVTQVPEWELSHEQERIFDIVVNHRRSVFLTGGAGTGKSHLLRAIIAALPLSTTFVTATTGLAALNLGGTTLHSFSGCGFVDQHTSTHQMVYRNVLGRKKARANWRKCRVLVVDEVSMLDAWFFDMLEYVARHIRGCRKPFGGIQLVLSGDFLQLPPVNKHSPKQETRLCFEAKSWPRVNPLVCTLSHQFRQKDKEFFSLLNEVRVGALTAPSLGLLSSLSVITTVSFVDEEKLKLKREVGAEAVDIITDSKGRTRRQRQDGFTILRARRSEVDAINTEKFGELDTEIYSYKGAHRGEGHFPSDLPSTVSVRAGCRVMLLANLDLSAGLANGSIGTVESFVSSKLHQTANPSTKDDLQHLADHMMLPVVRFDHKGKQGPGDGGGAAAGRLVVIEPHRWTMRQGDSDVSCSIQIPLQLAYAITIHKSQGMSLSHVNVDFAGIFEEGQAYVALSRCTDVANLVIENFDAQRVNPNIKALAYYRALEFVGTEHREAEKKLIDNGNKMNPWGPYDVEDFEASDDDNGGAVKKEVVENLTYDAENISCMVEQFRQRYMPQYIMFSTLRRRVLSNTEDAARVKGALLVMDTTSLLALTNMTGPTSLYQTIFTERGNMMRVPRVVKEELLFLASTDVKEVSSVTTPTLHSFCSTCSSTPCSTGFSYDFVEVVSCALSIMENAKCDFLLDEQREGEANSLPPVIQEWRSLSPLLMLNSSPDTGEKDAPSVIGFGERSREQHHSTLMFASFLVSRYSGNGAVYVCTETVELAARALAIGLRVCSIAYLCNRARRVN